MAAMFQDKYVFSQLTVFQNKTQFNNYVRKYDGNRYVTFHLLESDARNDVWKTE